MNTTISRAVIYYQHLENMCIFNKQARTLKEDNVHLKARIEELTKRAEKAERQRNEVINQYEADVKEKIAEITRLRNIVAGRDNTINQLKAELDKHRQYRDHRGRYTFRPKNNNGNEVR